MSRRPTRKRRSAASRLRPFWFLLAIAAIAAAAGLYFAATWPGFNPKSVGVTGNSVVPGSQILARAQISLHANVWLQNTRAAAARVRGIPYVNEVWIHRRLPARIEITVTERKPAAVLEGRNGAFLVDDSLRVLQPAPPGTVLPVFSAGVTVPAPGAFESAGPVRRLSGDNAQLAAAHIFPQRLQFDRFDDLVVTLRGGVKLLLGDDADLAQKAPLVGPILSQVSAGGRRIAAIDLRAAKTPVVQYR